MSPRTPEEPTTGKERQQIPDSLLLIYNSGAMTQDLQHIEMKWKNKSTPQKDVVQKGNV